LLKACEDHKLLFAMVLIRVVASGSSNVLGCKYGYISHLRKRDPKIALIVPFIRIGERLSIAETAGGAVDVRTHASVFKDIEGISSGKACSVDIYKIVFEFAEDALRSPLAALNFCSEELLARISDIDGVAPPDTQEGIVETEAPPKPQSKLHTWFADGFSVTQHEQKSDEVWAPKQVESHTHTGGPTRGALVGKGKATKIIICSRMLIRSISQVMASYVFFPRFRAR
jgi:hypothetical protein